MLIIQGSFISELQLILWQIFTIQDFHAPRFSLQGSTFVALCKAKMFNKGFNTLCMPLRGQSLASAEIWVLAYAVGCASSFAKVGLQ